MTERFAEWWDCTREEYDADTEYVRSSALKEFAECPSIYEARYIKQPGDHGYMGPKKQSRAMDVGTCLHAAALEGRLCWKVATNCMAVKKDGAVCGNSVAAGGMLWDVDAKHFVCGTHARGRNTMPQENTLTPVEDANVAGMVTALENSEAAQRLLEGRFSERAARSACRETGVKRKALVDAIQLNPFTIVDIKTTEQFNAESIWRKLDENDWPLSFAHYEAVIQDIIAAKGKPVRSPDWVVLVVESKPPYRDALWPIDGDVKETAQREYREYIAEFAECLRSGTWPQRQVNTTPPQWYFYRHGFAQSGSE